MTPFVRMFVRAATAAALALASAPLLAANDFDQKPETYICPNATGDAIECYLDAVPHLYTMCRQVKSIEIIEFGYERAQEGVNGAKSEYCVDKHKRSIARHFHAAMRAATKSRAATESLRALQEFWQKSLAELTWRPQESDDDYKARIARPYDEFRARAEAVRTALTAARQPPAKRQAATKAAAATKR
jgi:hypothetical protein